MRVRSLWPHSFISYRRIDTFVKHFETSCLTAQSPAALQRGTVSRWIGTQLSAFAIANLTTLSLGSPAALSNPPSENSAISPQIEAAETAADTPNSAASNLFSGTSQHGDTERLRQYLQRLRGTSEETSPTANSTANSRLAFPSLGSTVFNEQLASYTTYIETVGVPDVLIVGSSRALQGIDPEVLQDRLIQQGYESPNVYNFSVNGATAQVVNFILSELLPGELPGVIVWGDGSRAFNDGRRDRTWESLVASPGYQAIHRGEKPAAIPASISVEESEPAANSAAIADVGTSAGTEEPIRPGASVSDTIDALGFSAVGDRFDPAIYYRQFPRVSGQYDGAYSPFTLYGQQTAALEQAARFVESQNAQLIFVNLPLSSSYLDDFRLYHEGQFQTFLTAKSAALGFSVVDLLTQWESQPGFFADPSHINQHGAAAIADQLAQDPKLLLALTAPDAAPTESLPTTSPINTSAPELDTSDTGIVDTGIVDTGTDNYEN